MDTKTSTNGDEPRPPQGNVGGYAAQILSADIMGIAKVTETAKALHDRVFDLLAQGYPPVADIGVWATLLRHRSPDRRGSGTGTLPRHIPQLASSVAHAAAGFVTDFTVAKQLDELADAVWLYSMLLDDAVSENTRGLRLRVIAEANTRANEAPGEILTYVTNLIGGGHEREVPLPTPPDPTTDIAGQ